MFQLFNNNFITNYYRTININLYIRGCVLHIYFRLQYHNSVILNKKRVITKIEKVLKNSIIEGLPSKDEIDLRDDLYGI